VQDDVNAVNGDGTTGAGVMAGKFVITKDKRGEFRFVLKASNGEVIASSEGYAAKAGALGGIESVRKNAAEAVVDDQS
jgi:uncharacterized protein YegP (UPF0339 family)